ncbi:ABC transporter ATP-binding protein [Mucilaginibacter aquatilis]|uniref:ATP-binding cassette domain-containing protein n=1 Tax=Mucilaginibacter aquatilis TaxID=1517760 RepID=A0A6I4IQ40_9SPHI|nr:ABC transporter ATP-binding protein [Mucilaginibacter aquatilis]MVN90404.1 ATP-binding cassette domain-containing protein [Mucilaginibacter aquatilis]
MKTYFRLLSFAKPIEKFAIPYIIFTIFAVFFNTLNLALLAPLLQTLFSEKDKCGPAVSQAATNGAPSIIDLSAYFNYYVDLIVHRYGAWGALQFVCGVIIVSVILANVSKYLAQRTMENMRNHTLLNIRRSVFNNVMNLHLGYFNNERKGNIMAKVTSDVQTVQFSVTGTLQVIFKEPLQLIFYLVTLFAWSFKLTVFSLLVVPVAGFVISRIVKKLKAQAVMAQQIYSNMISYLDEALTGIKIVKAFNATDHIKEKFHEENKRYTNVVKAMARRQQLASPVSETMSIIMVSGIVLYGGYLVLTHQSALSASDFIAYIAIFSQLMRPAKAISDSFTTIHSGIAAGERVLELIDEKPAINDAEKASVITGFKNAIEFNNVSFAYGDREVLHNISFKVPAGKTVALVGPSGGGKSTIMDLIPRFTDVKSGEILVDGENIKQITMESLRGLLGVVNQESILFNDTIFNNIAFGKPGASAEQVEAAARIANAHEFIINTEEGYQTSIGDRGTKLSGGQKQRICIARAVLSNPPVMLLDEATSALDTESEKLVQEALNNLMKDRTSVIIAHRLSTIQNADIIIVIESGNVAEQGTHYELLQKNGLYKRLIDMQTFQTEG